MSLIRWIKAFAHGWRDGMDRHIYMWPGTKYPEPKIQRAYERAFNYTRDRWYIGD